MLRSFFLVLIALHVAGARGADWPTLRGQNKRDGSVTAELKPPYHLRWACEIPGERLGTGMEPIVMGGKLFVATHAGNLYALEAESGNPIWKFQAHGPFLHSPAGAGERIVCASTDGQIYALSLKTGELLWTSFAGEGGCSASPVIAA